MKIKSNFNDFSNTLMDTISFDWADELRKEIDAEIVKSIIDYATPWKQDKSENDFFSYYVEFKVYGVKFIADYNKSFTGKDLPPILEVTGGNILAKIYTDSIRISYSGNGNRDVYLSENSSHINMTYAKIRDFYISAIEDYSGRTISELTFGTIND